MKKYLIVILILIQLYVQPSNAFYAWVFNDGVNNRTEAMKVLFYSDGDLIFEKEISTKRLIKLNACPNLIEVIANNRSYKKELSEIICTKPAMIHISIEDNELKLDFSDRQVASASSIKMQRGLLITDAFIP